MQISKELIENDIKGMEAQVEQLKAQLASANGALAVLRNIVEYMDKPEAAVPAPASAVEAMSQPEISHALSEQELAELVAGPGATIEAIEPVHEVVNAQGKYEERVANG